MNVFGTHAHVLIAQGYSPVPLMPGEKRPLHKQWDTLRTEPMSPKDITALATQRPGIGVGIAGGYNGLVPIDIDTEDPKILAAVARCLPRPMVAKVGRRGLTLFYRTEETIQAAKFRKAKASQLHESCAEKVPSTEMLVEILMTGQTVIPPTTHPETGQPYRWLTKRTLLDTPVDKLSAINHSHIAAICEALKPWLSPQAATLPSWQAVEQMQGRTSDKRLEAYARRVLAGEVAMLAVMTKGGRNWQLFRSAAKMGKFVHHGILPAALVEAHLLHAARACNLIAEDGLKACRATLLSGIERAKHDPRPTLDPRRPGRQSQKKR